MTLLEILVSMLVTQLSLILLRSTPASLFLIFIDLRKSSVEIEQSVAYWCAFVNSSLTDRESTLQLIIVGTHEDELSKEGYRHKPAILEKITSTVVDGIEFCRWVTVNCS